MVLSWIWPELAVIVVIKFNRTISIIIIGDDIILTAYSKHSPCASTTLANLRSPYNYRD